MDDMNKATHHGNGNLYRYGWKSWYVWDNKAMKWKVSGIPLSFRFCRIKK